MLSDAGSGEILTENSTIIEYQNLIQSLNEISSYEVYRWLISMGKKLKADPLSKTRRISENQVTQCQADLYVDLENGQFKAWSNALVTAGYAYLLIDIFNNTPAAEAPSLTVANFEELGLGGRLSMIRKAGFYQMIEMMIERLVFKPRDEGGDLSDFSSVECQHSY